MQTAIDPFHTRPHRASSSFEGDEAEDTDDVREDAPELQWFDRASLTPIPPPLHTVSLLPYGFSGDRVWRARGWSAED